MRWFHIIMLFCSVLALSLALNNFFMLERNVEIISKIINIQDMMNTTISNIIEVLE